ncbi:MAG: choice-of-anchor D domain-containing protein, partial [Steroidobacteraceae bacterium]
SLVTVQNTGTIALPLTNITLSGANPGQFSQTNTCGTSVAVGTTCTISVVFKPTWTGSIQATLNVNAGAGAGTQTVALTGTGD